MNSLSSTSLASSRLSGKLNTLLPISKCNGVSGSSKSLADTYVRGLELMIDSTSTSRVCSWSRVTLECLIIFRIHLLVDFTNLSNAPPHYGAFSSLNLHCTPWLARYFCTAVSLNTVSMNLVAALKVFSLSDRNIRGKLLLPANRLTQRMKESIVKLVTVSRCTARLTRQVKRQIYTLFDWVSEKVWTWSGPAKSTPVYENGGSSLTRNIGIGGGFGTLKCPPSNLLQRVQWWMRLLTRLLPLQIQNFLLVSVNVSLVPSCPTRWWAFLTINAVREWSLGRNTGCLAEYDIAALVSRNFTRKQIAHWYGVWSPPTNTVHC